MLIDIVIPTYKPDGKLLEIIDMLSKQTVPVNQVIIINTEKEYWDKFVKEYDYKETADNICVHHITTDEFDHGKTRNVGMSYSNADVVIMMTQDAVPVDDRFTESLSKALESSKDIAVAYGRQMARSDSSLAEKFSRGFNYPSESRIKSYDDIERLGIKAFFCSDVCAAYKRDIFKSLGGFVNEAVFNEDMIFANKLLKNGYKIYYAADAKVYHTHEYSGMQQFKRNFDLAVSQKMHPEVFEGISSESEGIRYVKAAAKYFMENGKPLEIIPFAINCGFKFIGYRKGKRFDQMSEKSILRCTSNKNFFLKYFQGKAN